MQHATTLPAPERTCSRGNCATLFVSLELSRSTWVATALAPDRFDFFHWSGFDEGDAIGGDGSAELQDDPSSRRVKLTGFAGSCRQRDRGVDTSCPSSVKRRASDVSLPSAAGVDLSSAG